MSISFLTREGYESLQEELETLRNERREEISARLRAAIDEGGELIENAEYEAAKNEQAFVEGRIKELEILLATAKIADEQNLSPDIIHVGSKVVVQEDDTDPEEYTIVGAAEAKPLVGRISNESPLGKALINRKAGEVVEVHAPAGSFSVRIIEIK